MKLKLFLTAATVLALGLSGCATMPPEPLRGTYSQISPNDAQTKDFTGMTTVWGGVIAKTIPKENETCFEIISTRLDSSLRPREVKDDSAGRFMACRAGFYDPAVFAPNREVTFVGRINGYTDSKIGEYSYRYPKMDATTVYLWGKRQQYNNGSPYFSPSVGYWRGGGWGWGLGWGWPYW